MIGNDIEFRVAMERIAQMQAQVAELRRVEANPTNYHAASSGFLAEIDRMQLEVREYLSIHPGDPSLRNVEPAAGVDGGQ
jgi:hypothetical protein